MGQLVIFNAAASRGLSCRTTTSDASTRRADLQFSAHVASCSRLGKGLASLIYCLAFHSGDATYIRLCSVPELDHVLKSPRRLNLGLTSSQSLILSLWEAA